MTGFGICICICIGLLFALIVSVAVQIAVAREYRRRIAELKERPDRESQKNVNDI